MTAALYTFPVSRDLAAAREVAARPADFPTEVLDTALTVLDWHGTDEDRRKIAHLPQPALITGRAVEQLTEARRLGALVAGGEPQSLAALMTAQEVLEMHGTAEDGPALVKIEAAAMLTRMRSRRIERQETALEVALRHAHRWPEILFGAVTVAVAMLLATGWL